MPQKCFWPQGGKKSKMPAISLSSAITVWKWTKRKIVWSATWQTMALAWHECGVFGSFPWRNLAGSNVSSCSMRKEIWVLSWRWHFTLLREVQRAFQFYLAKNTVWLLAIHGCKNQIYHTIWCCVACTTRKHGYVAGKRDGFQLLSCEFQKPDHRDWHWLGASGACSIASSTFEVRRASTCSRIFAQTTKCLEYMDD